MTEIQFVLPPRDRDFLSESLRLLTQKICEANPELEGAYGLGGPNGYGENFENDVFVMRRFYWGDCDCGWMEKEDEWSNNHKHTKDCYWNVTRAEIEASEARIKCDEAIDRRDAQPFGSKAADEIQKEVMHWSDRHREFQMSVYRKYCDHFGIAWNDGSGCAVHCTCTHDSDWKEFLKVNPGHLETCSLELPNFRHKASGFEVRWYKWIGLFFSTRLVGCGDPNRQKGNQNADPKTCEKYSAKVLVPFMIGALAEVPDFH